MRLMDVFLHFYRETTFLWLAACSPVLRALMEKRSTLKGQSESSCLGWPEILVISNFKYQLKNMTLVRLCLCKNALLSYFTLVDWYSGRFTYHGQNMSMCTCISLASFKRKKKSLTVEKKSGILIPYLPCVDTGFGIDIYTFLTSVLL